MTWNTAAKPSHPTQGGTKRQQNVGPYALTGQTAVPRMVKLYNQKGHPYYVPQRLQDVNLRRLT